MPPRDAVDAGSSPDVPKPDASGDAGSDATDAAASETGVDGHTGCGVAPCPQTSGRAREILPTPTAELPMLAGGNTAFALKVFQALRADAPNDNLFHSPLSASLALAMTYAGARGTTATEMATALEFKLAAPVLHRAFNGLTQELARRDGAVSGEVGGEPVKLSLVNALWGRTGAKFLPEFLDTLDVNYGAGLRLLDFGGDTEGSRQIINRFVEQSTAGKIKDLIPTGVLRPDTILVLTNAIHFKAPWLQPFDGMTADKPFTLASGQTVNVPTMQRRGQLGYAETDDYQAVEIGYVGGKLSFFILAPKPGKRAAVEAALDGARLQAAFDAVKPTELQLELPKFSFDAKLSMKALLGKLGMPTAFTDSADFSGMNGQGGIVIGEVVHQAFIAIDEKGTEAAAATAVIAVPPSGPPPATPVKIDRPFLFFIRDRATGTVLFVGRLADPRP